MKIPESDTNPQTRSGRVRCLARRMLLFVSRVLPGWRSDRWSVPGTGFFQSLRRGLLLLGRPVAAGFRRSRSAVAQAVARSVRPLRDRDGFIGLSRRKTAWMVATVAGMLGLSAMLYLQLTTQRAAAGGNEDEHSPAARRVVVDATDPFSPPGTPRTASDADGERPEVGRTTPLPLPGGRSVSDTAESVSDTQDPWPAPESIGERKTNAGDVPTIDAGDVEFEDGDFGPLLSAPLLELEVHRVRPTAQARAPSDLEGRRLDVPFPAGEAPTHGGARPPGDSNANDGWRPLDGSASEANLQTEPSSRPAADRTLLEVPDLLVPAIDVNGEGDAETDVPLGDSDVPTGLRELDVSVTRQAPVEAVINQPMSSRILITNRGRQRIDHVVVEERVADGHRVISTSPTGRRQDGKLSWLLRDLKPGEVRKIDVQVVPTVAGAAAGVVSVKPVAAARAETESIGHRPQGGPPVGLAVFSPNRVAAGRNCVARFTVTNATPQPLTDLVLRVVLPEELVHRHGRSLDHAIARLAPGETHRAQLTTRATTTGTAVLHAGLFRDGGRIGQAQASVTITKSATERFKGSKGQRFKGLIRQNCR